MLVEFKFNIDQRVVTPFEEVGIVEMLGVDDGGNKYFVITPTNSVWFKEEKLKSAREDQ